MAQHLRALALREQIGDQQGIVRSRGAVAEARLRQGEAKVAAAMVEIRALDPSARAIVASGYSDDLTMARCREAGFAAALAKPFLKDELARAILEVQGVAAESD